MTYSNPIQWSFGVTMAFLLVGCSGPEAPLEQLAQNAVGALYEKDLAVIFPLDSGDPIRMTDLNASGQRYFPAAWYQAVLQSYERTLVGQSLQFENIEQDWRVVSARIVPCTAFANSPGPDNDQLCWPELRIVWQPVVRNISVGRRQFPIYADDRAIHALYDVHPSLALTTEETARAQNYLQRLRTHQPLTTSELADFIALRNQVTENYLLNARALRGLVDESAYQSHGVRPETSDIGNEQAFNNRFRAFMTDYAPSTEIKVLTSFSLPEGRRPDFLDDWVFLAFRGNQGQIVVDNIIIRSEIDGRPLIDLGHDQRSSERRDDPQLYLDNADPELVNSVILFTTDVARLAPRIRDRREIMVPNTSCASCHKLNDFRFDFHNLSYLEDRSVTISPRVTTDVALDLEWIAVHLNGAIPPDPNPTPPNDPIPQRYERVIDVSIPDNDPRGVVDTIDVDQTATIRRVEIEFEILHTYIGDLVVTLTAPNGQQHVLHNRAGGSQDNLELQTTITLDPVPAAGIWRLSVQDHARFDRGVIKRWAIAL